MLHFPAVSLLLKFFKFYGEVFDFDHVVSIRTHSNCVLTRKEAFQVASAGRHHSDYFKVAPLVVQDPFELSHNVTKLLNVSMLKKLCGSFRWAHSLLSQEMSQDRPSILSLFDVQDKSFSKSPRSPLTIVFTLQNIVQLLAQGQGGEGVAQGHGGEGVAQGQGEESIAQERGGEGVAHGQIVETYLQGLDLSNVQVRQDLGRLVLEKMSVLLSARYGFTYEEGREEREGELMGGRGVEGELMGGQGVEGELMGGQGVEGELMGGQGVEGELMGGQGVEGELMRGQGVEGELMGGQGVEGELMGGQGVEGELMRGQGVEGELMRGQGVEGELMGGQGVEGELMGGQGVEGELMGGQGVEGELMGGQGVEGELMGGQGVEGELMGGQGVEGELMGGRGVEGELMGGQGVEGELMGGQGVEGELMGGQGVEGELMGGQGVEGELMRGQGVEGELMRGQGVEGELMGGQGVEGELMGGQGVEGELMGGQGVEGELMGGQGVEGELMGGQGVEGELMGGQGVEGVLMGGQGVEEGLEGGGQESAMEMEIEDETVSVDQGGLCASGEGGSEEVGGGREEMGGESEEVGGGRKRALFEELDEDEELDDEEFESLCGSKRLKTWHLTTPSEPHPQVYICTAFKNTWVHSRRTRRAHLSGGSGPPLTSGLGGANSLAVANPVLQLKLTQKPLLPAAKPRPPDGTEEICAVVMEKLQGDKGDFYSFYGVIKKVLRHL